MGVEPGQTLNGRSISASLRFLFPDDPLRKPQEGDADIALPGLPVIFSQPIALPSLQISIVSSGCRVNLYLLGHTLHDIYKAPDAACICSVQDLKGEFRDSWAYVLHDQSSL